MTLHYIIQVTCGQSTVLQMFGESAPFKVAASAMSCCVCPCNSIHSCDDTLVLQHLVFSVCTLMNSWSISDLVLAETSVRDALHSQFALCRVLNLFVAVA